MMRSSEAQSIEDHTLADEPEDESTHSRGEALVPFRGLNKIGTLIRSTDNNHYMVYWDLFRGPQFLETSR